MVRVCVWFAGVYLCMCVIIVWCCCAMLYGLRALRVFAKFVYVCVDYACFVCDALRHAVWSVVCT